ATGYPRFTLGTDVLLRGVSFIPALIGMFALPELLRSLITRSTFDQVPQSGLIDSWKGVLTSGRKYWRVILRSSFLGTLIGALPGAGADIAARICFAIAKRFSKTPKRWGKGHLEGLIAGCSANNAALGGAWIPALVFA